MQGSRSETDQVVRSRLSVFAGDFSLAAAEAVCSGEGIDEGEIAALLSGLVDRSQVLVQAHGSETRYRVPEPLPPEAPERLVVNVQPDALRRRHAAFYSALAEQAWQESPGPRRAEWVDRLEWEHENLRAALQWSAESGEAEQGLRLAVALRDFWRHHLSEGHEWFAKLLALPQAAARTAMRAHALDVAGTLAFYLAYQSDDPESEDARTASSACGSLLAESLGIFQELDDKDGCATVLIHLGTRARLLDRDYAAAQALFEECLVLCRELGDEACVTFSTGHLAYLAIDRGDPARARSLVEENQPRNRKLGFPDGWDPSLLDSAARFAAAHGQPERALRLAGAAAAQREARSIPPFLQATLERALEPARRAVGEAAQARAWAEGHAMTPEHALAYALEELNTVHR